MVLTQKRLEKKVWSYDNQEDYFQLESTSDSGPIYCNTCGNEIGVIELTKLGMFQHQKKIKPGQGTNFHTVYNTDAALYHDFSLAEDRENSILNIFLQYKNNNTTILDIGCGTGKYANQLAPYVQKIYALDKSKELLSFARENNKNTHNIEYILSPAETIPLLDESVDMIISTWGSFSPNETIREMKRVLKPGGVIIRIGTKIQDDLTSLYPTFDSMYIKENNTFFTSKGFIYEERDIIVSFDSLEEARRVLVPITGSKEEVITKHVLTHSIAVHTYKKI